VPIAALPISVPSGSDDDLMVAAAVWPGESSHGTPSDIMVVHEAVSVSQLQSLAPGELGDVRCALPMALPPRARRRVLSILSSLDGVSVTIALDAPIAAFAHSVSKLGRSRPLTDRAPSLHVVALAQPDGAASVIVGDLISRQLVAIGQIVDPASAMSILTRAQGPLQSRPSAAHSYWTRRRPRTVRSMVGYGLDADITALFNETFGCNLVEAPNSAADAVLAGLAQLGELSGWSATWPTAKLHLGKGWTRQAGPLRADIEEYSARLRPDAGIRFSDETGAAIPVVAGSVRARGCVIPVRLGNRPRLRLVDDGQLLMFGPVGTRPLAAKLGWPIPGSGDSALTIRATGAAVELLEPEFADSDLGPEQIDHIEPQLSGQAQRRNIYPLVVAVETAEEIRRAHRLTEESCAEGDGALLTEEP
jgi:hypothetical protein